MKLAYLALTSAGILVVGAETPSTDYTAKRSVTTNHSITIEWEVSDAGMTIDGEEPDFGGGRGMDVDMSGESTRTVVSTDVVRAHADGQPTQVLRSFGDIGVTGSMTMGENEREIDNQSVLSGVKLALALEDGEVTAKVEEGEEPPEAALLGHSLTLGIDKLLPTGEITDGTEYEIGSSQVIEALGFQLEGTLFPRPERAEGGERPERGEGGGGRRGGRGGRGGGGGINMNQLAALDWDAKATYVGEQEVDDRTVVIIELELEAEGTLPERQRGGGRRGGGDRALGLEAGTLALETEASVELKGQLTWDPKAKRPISLELEGEFTVDMQNSRDTERGLFESWRTTEGEIHIQINYTEEAL